jgi:outer membrane biogenesis lipoprotein LolB
VKASLLSAAAVLLLAACTREAPAAAEGRGDEIQRLVSGAYVVDHFCHRGRAVYVFDGGKAGGMVVVENAAECGGEPL